MGLQVWLPLNGNLNDYGLANCAWVNGSNATVNSSGKIGSCYSFAQTSGNRLYYSGNVATFMNTYINAHSHSMSAWVNTTEASTCIFCLTYGEWFGIQNGVATFTLYNQTKSVGLNGTQTIADGTWHHIAATYDTSTNYMKIYVDGVLDNSRLYSSDLTDIYSSSWSNSILLSGNSNNSAASAWYFYVGKLNDLRIYDEALSDKEIKEIAKGCVLKYSLCDPYIEPTTNWNSTADLSSNCYNGATGKYNYGTTTDIYKTLGTFQGKYCAKVYMGTSGLSAYPYPFIDNITPAVSSYRTVSFDYYPTALTSIVFYSYNTSCTFSWRNGSLTGNSGAVTVVPNQWNHIEMTIYNSGTAASGCGYIRIGSGSHTSDTSNYWLFANIQIEDKNHATGFAGLGGTRTNTTVYDTSGFKYNGSAASSTAPQVIYGSARNNKSAYFDANTKFLTLNSTPLPTFTTGSVSFWLKANTVGSSGLLPFTGQSGSYYLMASSGWTGAFYNGNVSASGSIIYYVDGVVDNTPPGTDGLWHHYCVTGVNLSSWTALKLNNYSSVWNGSDVYYSDIRFYNTILTADDVKSLYNNPIEITNNGGLVTQGEIIEE